MNLPLRLVIVDDSELVRLGLRTLLSKQPGLEIVGEAPTAAGALTACRVSRPDVVLLDLRLPDGTGIEVCRAVVRETKARVLFLTSVIDDDMVADAIRAGAHGYLLKEIDSAGLVRAIHAVAEGGQAIDPTMRQRLMQALQDRGNGHISPSAVVLSAQDKRILALLTAGRTNKEIGAELGLAEKTIKNYLTDIFARLGFTRRAQAAAFYAQHHPAALAALQKLDLGQSPGRP
jgi:two-component system, NarL family, response regulator DevR